MVSFPFTAVPGSARKADISRALGSGQIMCSLQGAALSLTEPQFFVKNRPPFTPGFLAIFQRLVMTCKGFHSRGRIRFPGGRGRAAEARWNMPKLRLVDQSRRTT